MWGAITFTMLALSWLIANAVPFFSELMGIIAALSTAPLTFGFPALFYIVSQLRLKHNKILCWEWVMLMVLMLVAVFMLVVGVISNMEVRLCAPSPPPSSCYSTRLLCNHCAHDCLLLA